MNQFLLDNENVDPGGANRLLVRGRVGRLSLEYFDHVADADRLREPSRRDAYAIIRAVGRFEKPKSSQTGSPCRPGLSVPKRATTRPRMPGGDARDRRRARRSAGRHGEP